MRTAKQGIFEVIQGTFGCIQGTFCGARAALDYRARATEGHGSHARRLTGRERILRPIPSCDLNISVSNQYSLKSDVDCSGRSSVFKLLSV
jgi:hypothetical protein